MNHSYIGWRKKNRKRDKYGSNRGIEKKKTIKIKDSDLILINYCRYDTKKEAVYIDR